MKSSKLNEYVNMNYEDLQKELKETKKELFKLRFQHATGTLSNPLKISQVKKNIARLNTVLSSKKLEENKN